MSLRELWTEFAVARKAERLHFEARVVQAYHTACFAWSKDANRLLTRILKAGEKQTPKEQWMVMQQMANVYGLTMQRRAKADA